MSFPRNSAIAAASYLSVLCADLLAALNFSVLIAVTPIPSIRLLKYLNARRRRKFIPTTDSKHGLAVCENILGRQFRAEGGGQKRVSDITCLRACGGWVYLAVALDLFDRKVVGWALSDIGTLTK